MKRAFDYDGSFRRAKSIEAHARIDKRIPPPKYILPDKNVHLIQEYIDMVRAIIDKNPSK